MTSDLFPISETVRKLIHTASRFGDDLLHENLRGGNQIEFPTPMELTEVPGGKICDRGFGNQVGREQWSIDFQII